MADGSQVAGHDRSYLNPLIFGDDFRGKSLLDIGTYHGFFCLEAMQRGAARAVGLDPCAESLQTARRLAAGLELGPIYVHADFETWDSDKHFDVVLLLNVLHHMWDPIHALRKAAAIVNDKIVIELQVPRQRDFRKKKSSRFARIFGRADKTFIQEPMLLMGRAEDAQHTFLFTPAAISTIFEKHYTCFEPVEIHQSPFKERVIVCATKRKIDRLTVVAGVTGSGKSSFIKQLTESEDLRRKLEISGPIDVVVDAETCRDLPTGRLGHVVFSYDILRPSRHATRHYSRETSLTLLLAAQSVNVFTLDLPQNLLLEQSGEGQPDFSGQTVNMDASFFKRWQTLWLEHVAGTKGVQRHLLVENSGGNFSFKSLDVSASALS
jgi:2-polyprenyl-3-methyl-5-hydroxy-6-metoxy-1,4-benzoquinol methylase